MMRAAPLLLLFTACGRDALLHEPRPRPLELTILTERLRPGQVGATYTAGILADGPDPETVQWRIASGAVPGLTLQLRRGARTLLAGIPTTAGRFSLEVQATDGASTVAEMFEVIIRAGKQTAPLAIEVTNLPAATEGAPYTAGVGAAGGSEAGYRWRIAEGALPRGLAIAEAGTYVTTISGTPLQAGDFPFLLEVTDSDGNRDSEPFVLEVQPRTAPLTIITASLPAGAVGRVFVARIEATGGAQAGYVWESLDPLPPGLYLAAEGTPYTTLSGTPEATGRYPFTVLVSDRQGNADDQEFVVLIGAP